MPVTAAFSLAHVIGLVASFCFTLQKTLVGFFASHQVSMVENYPILRFCLHTGRYIPQALLNYNRKSVKGFNTTGIIIKLLGAGFLSVNAFLTGESFPVIAYGLLNIVQHSFFMIQFYLYSDQPNSHSFLLWTLFPVVPLILGLVWPDSMTITNGIKPLAQILSHLPQLMECARQRTTQGVSLVSQHLNAMGGLAGLYMLTVDPPVSATTYLLYINSVFQAFSIYLLACYYGEFNATTALPSLPSSFGTLLESPPSEKTNRPTREV